VTFDAKWPEKNTQPSAPHPREKNDFSLPPQVLQIRISELTQISNLLVTLNSSVNFVIYCIFGEKFKRVFCAIFW